MANDIPNLWSGNITNLKVLSPLAILRTQASNLETMTRGLLKVAIDEEEFAVDGKKNTFYNFDIVAPALNGYRHRLFALYHHMALVYPITFVLSSEIASETMPFSRGDREAYSEEDFTEKLGSVLQSNYTTSVIQSLIARSNENIVAENKDILGTKS